MGKHKGTPHQPTPSWVRLAAQAFVGVSLFIGVVASLWSVYFLVFFYQSAAATARGSSIRPMGASVFLVILGFWTLLVGIVSGEIGVQVCRDIGDRKGMTLGKRALILNALTFPLTLLSFLLIMGRFGFRFGD